MGTRYGIGGRRPAHLLWTLAFAAALGVPARAVVEYMDVPDAPATYDGAYLTLGGTAHVEVYRSSGSYAGEIIDWTWASSGDGSAVVAFHPASTSLALGLGRGEPVGPHLAYKGFDGILVQSRCKTDPKDPTCSSTGDWVGTEKHLGIRFTSPRGTHYGWVRLGHPGGRADGGYTPVYLYDCAWETEPDTLILAGSRNSLSEDLKRALRIAAGISAASPGDISLLDRAGEAGRIDIADAALLARLSSGLG